jgi:glyoxylase-like metal-dependent hydrolase (beta-lactamase superfamily II)
MIVHRFEVGAFAMNCYLVICDQTRSAALIDPGDEADRIILEVARTGAQVDKILITHAHLDHVKESRRVKEHYGVPLLMHEADAFLLKNLTAQAQAFGLGAAEPPEVDQFVAEGDRITVGELEFEVLHTPGHSPGSVTYVHPGHAFAGDVLFAGSIGRTDLPGGSYEQLIQTIRTKLLPLGDETVIYPGHGPKTTVGQERRTNPFLLAT